MEAFPSDIVWTMGSNEGWFFCLGSFVGKNSDFWLAQKEELKVVE